MQRATVAIVVVAVLLCACSSPTPEPTATPSAHQVAVQPTETPLPTSTAVPSATPTITPTNEGCVRATTEIPEGQNPTRYINSGPASGCYDSVGGFLDDIGLSWAESTPGTVITFWTQWPLDSEGVPISPTPTPAPTPHDVPPVIRIQAPTDAFAGERVVLDASSTFDHDGDSVSFTWRQVHNPDLYTGSEYVTGNEVALESYDQPATAFAAQWPGNYRFEVVATDKDGSTSSLVDVAIRRAQPPAYETGMTVVASTSWHRRLTDVDSTLSRIQSVGARWVVLMPTWYLNDYTDTNIRPFYRDEPGFPETPWFTPTLTDSELESITEKAHSMGLHVMLKPIVDPLNVYTGGTGRWGLNPAGGDWDALFDSYTRFIVHYAEMAEHMAVEILCIGTEMNSMTDPDYVLPNPDPRWRQIVTDVRSVYSGKVTYTTDLHGPVGSMRVQPKQVTFWDALDYIGIDVWVGLTNDLNPSVEEMRSSFADILNTCVTPLALSLGKKVIVVEVGFNSYDGANSRPLDSLTWGNANQSVPDWGEQAELYEAFLAAAEKNEVIDAVFIYWGLVVGQGPTTWILGPPKDTSPWLWDKPAEQAIRIYWE